MSRAWIGLGLAAAGGYMLWRSTQVGPEEGTETVPWPPSEVAWTLLSRAAPLLRLPTSPDHQPEVLDDASGLRCPTTGRVYPYRGGILDVLEREPELTITQRSLDTPLSSLAYDRLREVALRLAGVSDFAVEVAGIQRSLQVTPGDAVLDLACGHGVFTVEWAKRAGPAGLVIGLDLSPAMLARAARHARRWGLENVLLVRGDAQHLPLRDGALGKVNCSGGFHQFPDLSQALREIARVSTRAAVLTASTFASEPGDRRADLKRWLREQVALHFVELSWLEDELRALGYGNFQWTLPGGWFAYTSASR
jgi:SAM-dependent methyltransferase